MPKMTSPHFLLLQSRYCLIGRQRIVIMDIIFLTKGKRTTKDKLDTSANSTAITAMIHQCIGSCNVHGHNHNNARLSNVPVNNYTAFWGALGCSCFAF